VRFYFTGTEFLYDYNANLSKAFGAKRLPLTILWHAGLLYTMTVISHKIKACVNTYPFLSIEALEIKHVVNSVSC